MLTPLIDYVNCLALTRCQSAIAKCNFSFFVLLLFSYYHVYGEIKLCIIFIWQIRVTEIVGPRAEEFLLKVQKASAGPPWHVVSPDSVRLFSTALHHLL